MRKKCVALGELLLRMKAPASERLFQSGTLEASFGGGEANALVSLSNYGWQTEMLTGLPDHAVGSAAVAELRKHGVGTAHIVRQSGRMGSYFLEAGAAQRPSKVVYDRAGSVFAGLSEGAFDLEQALTGAEVFLVSGITPAVSREAAGLALAAIRTAKELGLQTVLDFNYRSMLWQYGVEPPVIMAELAQHADIIVAGIEDLQIMLGIHIDDDPAADRAERYKAWAAAVFEAYPGVGMAVCSLRESLSASHNRFSACMVSQDTFYRAKTYDMAHIIDRVGAGDALIGGLIHGLYQMDQGTESALEFATAAACLKHSIPGDFNRVSAGEVLALAGGDGAGRVIR